MKTFWFCLWYMLLSAEFSAQAGYLSTAQTESPRVFLLSDGDDIYADLVSRTSLLLMEVCNNSMDEAYKKWMFMLADMEDYALEKDFDLKGLKIWINVFWNADGSIHRIIYYPKPISKNIDYSNLTLFLESFCEDYQSDIQAAGPFAHYGSASFPTFVDQFFPERKQ